MTTNYWSTQDETYKAINTNEISLHNIIEIKQKTKHCIGNNGRKFKVKIFFLTNKDGHTTEIKAFS